MVAAGRETLRAIGATKGKAQHPPIRYAGRIIPWSARPLEKDVQRTCIRLLRLCEFTIYPTSQYRASHVAKGVADLLLQHDRMVGLGAWETKRPGERLTADQLKFALGCQRSRTVYGWGTDEDLKQWLMVLGFAHTYPAFGIRQRSAWPEYLPPPTPALTAFPWGEPL